MLVGELLLVRAGTPQKTSLLSCPLSARKVTQVCILCTVRFALWVDVQDYPHDLSPISPFAFGLQKARVRHDMLLVIGGSR
jgi:hypothetical protein